MDAAAPNELDNVYDEGHESEDLAAGLDALDEDVVAEFMGTAAELSGQGAAEQGQHDLAVEVLYQVCGIPKVDVCSLTGDIWNYEVRLREQHAQKENKWISTPFLNNRLQQRMFFLR